MKSLGFVDSKFFILTPWKKAKESNLTP